MRIAIDIRSLQTGSGRRGVGVYTRELVRALLKIDTHNEYLLLAFSKERDPELPVDFSGKIIRLRRPERTITVWDQLLSYRLMRKLRIDVFHSPFYGTPFVVPGDVATVQTIHDLTPLLFKGSVSFRNWIVFRINFNLARYTDRIIAVSENTKSDIVKNLKIPAEKVAVIYNGIDHLREAVRAEATPWRGEFRIERPYLLYVGGLDPMKNVPVLIRAFDKISKNHGNLKLLIVGAERGRLLSLTERSGSMRKAGSGGIHEFSRLCEDLLTSGKIVLEGFVENEALLSCYRNAELFVFPSLYEGFGLPPLEAMSMGLPVIASSRGSLPEVLADAALYVNPEDSGELSAKIEEVMGNEPLKEKMRSAGLKRAGEFLWEGAARKTLDLYGMLHRTKHAT